MEKILVISHGNLASEICTSNSFIMGTKEAFVSSLCLNEQGLEYFQKQLHEYLENNKENTVYVLCDIIHGTPFNEVIINKVTYKYENLKVITGVNVTMLLTLTLSILNQQGSVKEKCNQALQSAIESIQLEETI